MIDQQSESNSDKNQPLTKAELAKINSVIAGAAKAVINNPTNKAKKKLTPTIENQIEGVLTEYLDTFVILGYTPDGIPINMLHASNPRDFYALRDMFNTTRLVEFNHENKDD